MRCKAQRKSGWRRAVFCWNSAVSLKWQSQPLSPSTHTCPSQTALHYEHTSHLLGSLKSNSSKRNSRHPHIWVLQLFQSEHLVGIHSHSWEYTPDLCQQSPGATHLAGTVAVHNAPWLAAMVAMVVTAMGRSRTRWGRRPRIWCRTLRHRVCLANFWTRNALNWFEMVSQKFETIGLKQKKYGFERWEK